MAHSFCEWAVLFGIIMMMFRDERIWRFLTDFWTVVLLAFLIANFLTKGQYDFVGASFSVIYAGVLGLYVGTKEFDRWYEFHSERHPGEIFIFAWTGVIFLMFAAQIFLGRGYQVSQEAVADYIMVLSVFALTQKSKKLYRRKRSATPRIAVPREKRVKPVAD